MFCKPQISKVAGALALLALLSGCATGRTGKPSHYTFFPPSPDEPRIQFLTSFSSDLDIGRDSKFVDFITGVPTAEKQLVKPYGLAMRDGRIFVCDTVAGVIQVFDLVKKRADYFTPKGDGRLQTPINIAFDKDGTRYVADNGRQQVLIYDKDGVFVAAIGTTGEMAPCDVAVAGDRILIADLKAHCVRVYDKKERKPLFTIPRDPKATEGKLFSPANMAVDEKGRVFVSDIGGSVVQVYDSEGAPLRTIGKPGVGLGMFARPKGVAVDHTGITYVVDANEYTEFVQMFDPEGRLLMFFGKPGTSIYGELILPAGITIDYDNVAHFKKYVAPGYDCEYVILVTSQFGSRKVNAYGFLKKK